MDCINFVKVNLDSNLLSVLHGVSKKDEIRVITSVISKICKIINVFYQMLQNRPLTESCLIPLIYICMNPLFIQASNRHNELGVQNLLDECILLLSFVRCVSCRFSQNDTLQDLLFWRKSPIIRLKSLRNMPRSCSNFHTESLLILSTQLS
jgi:hypothetical protein